MSQPPVQPPGSPDHLGTHPVSQPGTSRRGRRIGYMAGGVVGVLAVGGAAAWAVTSFFGTGAQPADALPAKTVAYVSLDLDPSGGQKVEALKTLRKFPDIRKNLDLTGDDDDLRAKLFEEAIPEDCDLTFADDVKPWLGNRFAMAAVDTGADEPVVVGVVQISDADGAVKGAKALASCSDDAPSKLPMTVRGDWMTLSDTKAHADEVADLAEKKPLAQDSSFLKWTEKVGGAGLVNMYASAGAGDLLADQVDSISNPFASQSMAVEPAGPAEDSGPTLEDYLEMGFTEDEVISMGLLEEDASADPYSDDPYSDDSSQDTAMPAEVGKALRSFTGAAAVVRFKDGTLEFEAVADQGAKSTKDQADAGELVGSLPLDTAAAFGLALQPSWAEDLLDQIVEGSDGELDRDELIGQVQDQTGLVVPDDAQALLGDGLAFGVGSNLDTDSIKNAEDSDDLTELPVGLKVLADKAEVDRVLAALLSNLPPEAAVEAQKFLLTSGDDQETVISPNSDYRDELAETGSLSDSKRYRKVVDGGEWASVLFLNLNPIKDWVKDLDGVDADTMKNIEPLDALGMTVGNEDGMTRMRMRLVTD